MQGETLFISDLHLNQTQPEILMQLLTFIDNDATGSDALYILGDLFEVWLGDDDDNPDYHQCMDALKQLSDSGTPIYVMHGNRDFLLGAGFEKNSGSTLLPDPSVIDLYGTPALIMHGDLLCSEDHDYQNFRRQVRNEQWQQSFLQKPLDERKQIATDLREQSVKHNELKAENIMDVTPSTVAAYMHDQNVHLLIHGHTHRPSHHHWREEEIDYERIVLGDWFTQGSVLRASPAGYNLESLAR
jgi:UDP-2,3-diacylglucosamine hydrolase